MAEGAPRASRKKVIRAVGWVTFLEIIRDKVLYNIVLCTVLLLGIGFLASRLTFTRQERVIINFGMSALSISCAMIAIFTGSAMLGREFERRTIFVALSRPITRLQFIVGKFAGLGLVILLNWALLSLSLLVILWETAGAGFFQVLSGTMALGLFLVLLQSLVLAGLAVMFSSFSTTSLASIVTIGLYLIGTNISQIRLVANRVESGAVAALLNSLATVLPNLEYFNLGTKVTYGIPVSWQFAVVSVLYGTVLIALTLVGSGLLVQKRES